LARYKLIVNPLAGIGNGEKQLPAVLSELARVGIVPDVVRTERHLHAVELARQALADGYDTILAMGGDGTFNEVLNGMMSHYKGEPLGALGIIPAGSGNDFRVAIDWPVEVAEVCQRIASGSRRLIDVGKMNDRYFLNVAGFGFDTNVSVEAFKLREVRALAFLKGLPLYFLAILKTLLLNYDIPATTIHHDEQTLSQPTLMTAVANGLRYGGGFLIAPSASADDGLFDLVVAGNINRLGILKLIPHLMKGTHIGKKDIYATRARHIIAETAKPITAQIDGEIYRDGRNRLEFSLLPKTLWILA
jgi:YegS/Rv2252/BmrU family lipid kinase